MGRDLVGRASATALTALVPVSLICGWLAGWPGALGALSGGLLSLGSLHWLSRGVRSTTVFLAGGRAHPLWGIALGLRYTVLFGAVVALLWSGIAHPVALLVGLSVLPPVLIVLGLRERHGLAS